MITFNLDTRKKLIAGAIVLSQTLLLAPTPVLADSSVRIAGQSLFSVPAAGSTTADQRAETIQNNLDNALVAAKDRTPSSVNITYVKGLPVITLGGYQVVTIDAATAKTANTTPANLAKKWADSIRGQLSDQTSIQSYVSQLTGSYASSAPAVASAPPIADQAPINNATPVNYSGNASVQNYSDRNAPNPLANQAYQGGMGQGQTAPQQQYGGQAQYGGQNQYNNNNSNGGGYGGPQYGGNMRGRVAYAPAGLSMPISLRTAISTQVAKPGDLIEAQISQTMYLGDATIPSGSTVVGTITDAEAGRRLSRSGELSIKFNTLRTPDGIETPISAHLVGGIGKYQGKDGSEVMRGEGMTAKLGQTAIRGGVGAGVGAALGTGLGAIAGRSGGAVGRGAWGGAAIGGGVGAATMLMRKGRDVIVPSGTQMNLQLDAPATIAGGGGGAIAQPPYGNPNL